MDPASMAFDAVASFPAARKMPARRPAAAKSEILVPLSILWEI